MISAISSSLAGLQAASGKANGAAARIADPAAAQNDTLVSDIVDLKTAEIAFKANAAALRAADEMEKETGKLFDQKV